MDPYIHSPLSDYGPPSPVSDHGPIYTQSSVGPWTYIYTVQCRTMDLYIHGPVSDPGALCRSTSLSGQGCLISGNSSMRQDRHRSRSCVTLYLLAYQMRVSAGDSCACCCIRVTSVELIDSPCLSILLPAIV